jgi:hypothetical protein
VPPDRFTPKLTCQRGFLLALSATFPSVGERVTAANRVGPIRGLPGLPGWLRRPWGPGWALVGDAGYFKDLTTAHGITDALRDAELLAIALEETLDGRSTPAETLGHYEQVRDELSVLFFAITDRIASFHTGRQPGRPSTVFVEPKGTASGMWDTASARETVMSASTRTVRRARRVAGWAAVVTFLAVLTATFIVGPAECVSTVTTNAVGVSTSGPLVCPLAAVVPLVLLGVFVVAWIATVVWAAARRRSGVEPDSTEVPMFPQGF